MGSGFNFFLNVIDKTPATTGAWVDIDVSGDGVPSGSTGVIVKIVNTDSTAAQRGEVRKNGSTDNFVIYLSPSHTRYAFVGIDANRILEAYITSTLVKIYLVGYADENCGFFDNAVDKTPTTTGSWQDVDASGNIPSDSTGVICLLYDSNFGTTYSGGIRKNGSTDEYPYGQCLYNSRFTYQLCGVDSSQIFEAKIENTALKVKLVGYTKSPITFFTNGIDKSLSAASTWTDIDVTTETDPAADGAIILMKNTNTATDYAGDIRKNGSTDNHTSSAKLRRTGCHAAAIGMDSGQVFEGWIENVAVDFYLIGYCKPAAAGVTHEIYVDAITKSLATPAEQCIFNILKDASVSSQAIQAPETTFNISKDAISQALASIILEIVTGIIEIFKDAIATAQATLTSKSTFNISKDAITQALATALFEIGIFRDVIVQASATSSYEVTFSIPLDAIVKTISTPALESTFNVSPEAMVKVLAEVSVVREAEVRVTKLFLMLGNLAVQIQGD